MNLGLYIHIPFCHHICHYCDFAKTSNFTPHHTQLYIQRLAEHLQIWLDQLQSRHREAVLFDSVFFGGGTPSMLSTEYASLFAVFRPHLAEGAEISMEVNPDDISDSSLSTWQELGVNRLSIGIQTFNSDGLQRLQRRHDAQQALAGLSLATTYFKNVSVDLIYGWPGQSLTTWQEDLQRLNQYELTHASLYTLMFEGATPLGRAHQRGRIDALSDELLLDMYTLADDELSGRGFEHIEVSNWAKPGFICKHNWGYWHNRYYLGIGSGAHGYLPSLEHDYGWRYSYPKEFRRLLASASGPKPSGQDREAASGVMDLCKSAEKLLGITPDEGRSDELRTSWLTEYLLGSIRTKQGVDLQYIRDRSGLHFHSSAPVTRLLNEGRINRHNEPGREFLVLPASEWFRETHWILTLLPCFHENLPRATP